MTNVLLPLLFALPLAQVLAMLLTARNLSALDILREASRKISFQIPLALAMLAPILAAGTLNLRTIALQQSPSLQHWLIFHNPFNLFAFILAGIAIQGVSKIRLPERPASRLARINENALLLVLSLVQTSLFLGAWYDPFGLIRKLETASHQSPDQWTLALLAALLGLLILLAKSFALVYLQNLLRKNLPRYRFDEVLRLCQKILLPAAACNLLAAAAYLWVTQPLPEFQADTQILLALIGLALFFILAGFLTFILRAQRRYVASAPSSSPSPQALSDE